MVLLAEGTKLRRVAPRAVKLTCGVSPLKSKGPDSSDAHGRIESGASTCA